MNPMWLYFMTLLLIALIPSNSNGQYNDYCVQHRECVHHQYCSGMEFACCSPAYDDPTNSFYCWCCKQDCQFMEGNYCRNASYGSGYRYYLGVNSTSSETGTGGDNLRRRKTPHPQPEHKITESRPKKEDDIVVEVDKTNFSITL